MPTMLQVLATTFACLIVNRSFAASGNLPFVVQQQQRSGKAMSIFTPSEREAFERDGYLVVRGMIDDEHLEELVKAGKDTVRLANTIDSLRFSSTERGIMFAGPSIKKEDNNADVPAALNSDTTNAIIRAFRHAALRAKFGKACAELMQLDPTTQNVRVLRDVFLAKPVDTDDFCDWHVDDQSFWPESFLSSASMESGKDQDGINVWIALDDMPAEFEGSMAVAKGSHARGDGVNDDWRHDAYAAIGQDRTKEGGENTPEEIVQAIATGRSTCSMGVNEPELRERIEKAKVVLDLKRGDAIFATRLLFHRTLPVTAEGREYYRKMGIRTLNRYSIRYVPGTARLPIGSVGEYSVVVDDGLKGKTLDEAVAMDENCLWYPMVWPAFDRDMDLRMDRVATEKLPPAKVKSDELLKEFVANLKKARESISAGGSSTSS